MTAGELKAILDRVSSNAEILIGESESAITDDFLSITGAYRHIDYTNHRNAVILIEQTEIEGVSL